MLTRLQFVDSCISGNEESRQKFVQEITVYNRDMFVFVEASDDIAEMVLMAFATITQEDCLGWVKHCGY